MASTKDMLLDAAEAGIRRNGYNAVSFRDLANGLGIKSASVHYHFPRKEDLGTALVARYAESFFATLDSQGARASTPRGRVYQFCDAYKSALAASDAMCLCGVLGAESASLPSSVTNAVNDFFDRNISWLEIALPAEWPAEKRAARAVQIVATLQGSMMLSHAKKDHSILDQSAAELVEAIPA